MAQIESGWTTIEVAKAEYDQLPHLHPEVQVELALLLIRDALESSDDIDRESVCEAVQSITEEA